MPVLMESKSFNNSTKRRDFEDEPRNWKRNIHYILYPLMAIFSVILIIKISLHPQIPDTTRTVLNEKNKSSMKKSSPNTTQKPNFIFILSDDVGFGTIDNTEFPYMQYINELAKKGIVMENYYTQELCTPSRAALLTGRYPISLGMQYNVITATDKKGLNIEETLLPEVLKSQGNYSTYAFGKWNLGHSSPDYLPTARGFDHFLGYIANENSYWTKSMQLDWNIKDFTIANTKEYGLYNFSDSEVYSTHFYRDKALDVINNHDFDSNPLFLYIAFQAAHTPYYDKLESFAYGIPDSYVNETIREIVIDKIQFELRRQYTLSLIILDHSIQRLVDGIKGRNQLFNTYIIYASDNGGCYESGGYNGRLRGAKGTLFEGGTKVDAFIYGPNLATSRIGSRYKGLMHVSDWFPTILDIANISYIPTSPAFALDGLSHRDAWFEDSQNKSSPRSFVLYNIYSNVEELKNKSNNIIGGIRDQRYKLLNTYVGNTLTEWTGDLENYLNGSDSTNQNNSAPIPQNITLNKIFGPFCKYELTQTGQFQHMLFDLKKDPYETENLFNNPHYEFIKVISLILS